jgi:hypothetical protein
MNKTISVRMMEPVVRVRTQDSPRYSDDVIGAVLSDMEGALGLLDPGDLSRVRAILAKYGNRSAFTTRTGVTSSDAARRGFDAQLEYNRAVAAEYKTFWDEKNLELGASITR